MAAHDEISVDIGGEYYGLIGRICGWDIVSCFGWCITDPLNIWVYPYEYEIYIELLNEWYAYIYYT